MAGELQHAQKVLRELRKALKNARANPAPRAVHKLRTTSRRLEAFTETLPSAGIRCSHRLLKAVAGIRKAAGRVRDMDVLAADARKLSGHAPDASLANLLGYLKRERAHHGHELQHKLDRESKDTQDDLKQLCRQLPAPLAPAGSHAKTNGRELTTESAVEITAQHLARSLRQWPRLTAQNIHEFRLAIKQLRYLLQLSDRMDSELDTALGNAQRRIGEWHDWQQLGDVARQALGTVEGRELLEGIDKNIQQRLSRALAAANELRRRYLRGSITQIPGC